MSFSLIGNTGAIDVRTFDLERVQVASALQGELLLLGGANDTSTQADLFKMSELLIRMGKPHEMMYPESGHGAMGATAEYDLDLKRQFFVRRLGSTKAGTNQVKACGVSAGVPAASAAAIRQNQAR